MAVMLLLWRRAVAVLKLQPLFRDCAWQCGLLCYVSTADTDLHLLIPCVPTQDCWKEQGSG